MRMRIPDPGIFLTGIWDGKKSDAVFGINLPDPQHWIRVYLEYQSVSPFVGIVSLHYHPPPPQASVSPQEQSGKWRNTLACGEGDRGTQFRRRDGNSGTLCIL